MCGQTKVVPYLGRGRVGVKPMGYRRQQGVKKAPKSNYEGGSFPYAMSHYVTRDTLVKSDVFDVYISK